MANMQAAAPVEEAKLGDYLHDRARIPEAPRVRPPDLVRRYLPFAFGLLFAAGAMALAFTTRATWTTQRDWVVPVTTPFWAIAGVALGYLVARGKFQALASAGSFLVLALVLTFINVYRGYLTEGQDDGRDALSILTAFVLAIVVLLLIVAVVRVVVERSEPPAQEV